MSEQATITGEEYAAWKLRRVVVGTEPIVHRCGHEGIVHVYDENYFHEERIAAVVAKDCKACRAVRSSEVVAAQQEARRLRKAENIKRDEERRAEANKEKENRKLEKKFYRKSMSCVPLDWELVVSRRSNLAWHAALTANKMTVSVVIESGTEELSVAKIANRLAWLWYQKEKHDSVGNPEAGKSTGWG